MKNKRPESLAQLQDIKRRLDARLEICQSKIKQLEVQCVGRKVDATSPLFIEMKKRINYRACLFIRLFKIRSEMYWRFEV